MGDDAGRPRDAYFVPLMFELARAYQAFADYDAAGFAGRPLAPLDADVVFTLGRKGALPFKDIGAETLITKSTLTGVVDRLEGKGLVRRVPDREDRRRTLVMLTARGEALFERELPRQVAHLRARFDRLDKQEIAELQRLLRRLREVFS